MLEQNCFSSLKQLTLKKLADDYMNLCISSGKPTGLINNQNRSILSTRPTQEHCYCKLNGQIRTHPVMCLCFDKCNINEVRVY